MYSRSIISSMGMKGLKVLLKVLLNKYKVVGLIKNKFWFRFVRDVIKKLNIYKYFNMKTLFRIKI